MAVATSLARVLGLFREILSAKTFGTTAIYDAFLLAFMIPNFFRGLLAEGALSSAFIPVYTEYLSLPEKRSQAEEVVNLCFTLSFLVTTGLYLVILIAVGFILKFLPETSRWFNTFLLLRFTFPYLIFVSLSALSMGVLHAHKHFFWPALSPIVLDLAWIGALLWLCPLMGNSLERQILGLGAGVLVGGLGQFLLQWPMVKKKSGSFHLRTHFGHPALRQMGRLLAPVIIGVAVGPINLLVDYSLAHFLSSGMVSSLWYATRLYQLPLGIFAISISTATLPWLAQQKTEGNLPALASSLVSSLSLVFAILLPCSFGLILLRKEIISFLFQRGMFSSLSVEATAFALGFYALGLIAYGAISVLTRAFYAFQDTKTPVQVGVISIGLNFLLDIGLMRFLRQGGIALSTTLVGFGNFLLLLFLFRRKHLPLKLNSLFSYLGRIGLASLGSGLVLALLRRWAIARLHLSILLIACIIATATVYLFLLVGTGYFKVQPERK
ncbi:MAG: murein biosynthesis integral membrane protein MurJ [Candidatus Omnitrophica bacterium]|nr:murein biosynthesis integral membrane protein MurJ [Candidatus Omnitrophota bacterium]